LECYTCKVLVKDVVSFLRAVESIFKLRPYFGSILVRVFSQIEIGSFHISYKAQTFLELLEKMLMSEDESSLVEGFRVRLENSAKYGEIWEVVKDTVEFILHRHRRGMMLFLDDLPIRLGAYHPLGTNNLVLNRTLVQIVEGAIKSKRVVNALIYNLLLHEYLHALGLVSEIRVRQLVYEIARKSFGENHIATLIAEKSPWALLKGIPLETVNASKRVMEIVKDFEKADKYVV